MSCAMCWSDASQRNLRQRSSRISCLRSKLSSSSFYAVFKIGNRPGRLAHSWLMGRVHETHDKIASLKQAPTVPIL